MTKSDILLPNPLFLRWFLSGIKNAKKTIVIVNYMAVLKKGDKRYAVASIVHALVDAVKRGVHVRIVLEGSKLQENYAFWRALKDAGADVWLDTSVTFIHTKAVLIDDRILCVGSHNITDAALHWSEEISLATSDPSAIRRFKREYERYTKQRNEIGDAANNGVLLPATIMEPLVKIKRSTAFRAYLVYLLLCYLDRGIPKPIAIDAQSWVEILKLPTFDWGANSRIKLLFEFMNRKLGIVQFDEKRKIIKRTAVPKSKGRILLPDALWDFKWHLRLSADAIHYYILGEVERQMSPYAPWWRLKRDQIAKRYGFQKQLVNRAQVELRRYDLLEILYETATSSYRPHIRFTNYFRQNPFYDYDKRMIKLEGLNKIYSMVVVLTAKKIASVICIDSDYERIKKLCEYIDDFGLKKASSVLQELSGLAPNSSRRTFNYAEELFGVDKRG